MKFATGAQLQYINGLREQLGLVPVGEASIERASAGRIINRLKTRVSDRRKAVRAAEVDAGLCPLCRFEKLCEDCCECHDCYGPCDED